MSTRESPPRSTHNVSVTIAPVANYAGNNCFASTGNQYGTYACSTSCLRAHYLRLSGEFVFKLTGGGGHFRWWLVQAYRRRRDRQSQVPWLSSQIVSVQLSNLPSRIPGIQAIHAVPDELHHAIHANGSQPVLATQ